MTSISLPGSTLRIGPLGFGAAYLVGGFERRKSVRLVHAAFDAGIRHFDVAPIYGLGTAEDTLGDALRDRRNEVTIATKVGLSGRAPTRKLLLAHAIYQPIKRWVPMRRPALRTPPLGRFDVAHVSLSLRHSLQRLRTEYLDLLLLHEVRPEQITDELLDFLVCMRAKGIVRAVGLATSLEASKVISGEHPGVFDVHQFGWSVLDQSIKRHDPFRITHGAILGAISCIREIARKDQKAWHRLSLACGVDLFQEDQLGTLLLAAALNENPGGLVLVASRRHRRVAHFTDALEVEARRRATVFRETFHDLQQRITHHP